MKTSPFASVPGVALSLAVLSAASLAAISYSANGPLIRQAFALTEAEIGAMASFIYAGAAASSVVSGRLTDRLGPERVLAIAMVALVLGCALSAMASGAALFFAGLAVVGLGYGAVNPPSNVLANPRSARWRGLSMSVKQSGIPLGGLIAGIVVPSVANGFGWRSSMLVSISTSTLLAVISAIGRFERSRSDQQEASPRPAVRLQLPRAFAFGFFMAGVQVAIFVLLAVYLVDERAMTPTSAGSALALLLFGGLCGRPAWGWLSDRLHHDRGRVLQVSASLAAACLASLAYVGGELLPFVLFGIGLCSVGWNGVYIAAVSEAVRPGRVGSTTGRALLLVNLGAVLFPPVVGLVAARTGSWAVSWAGCAALSVVAVLVLQWSRAGRSTEV